MLRSPRRGRIREAAPKNGDTRVLKILRIVDRVTSRSGSLKSNRRFFGEMGGRRQGGMPWSSSPSAA